MSPEPCELLAQDQCSESLMENTTMYKAVLVTTDGVDDNRYCNVPGHRLDLPKDDQYLLSLWRS
jgi:hypothetical protein